MNLKTQNLCRNSNGMRGGLGRPVFLVGDCSCIVGATPIKTIKSTKNHRRIFLCFALLNEVYR